MPTGWMAYLDTPWIARAEIKGFFDGFDERWVYYKHVESHRVVNANLAHSPAADMPGQS
jgi:hypothetical protein